jgi:hypothetical protein
MGMNRILIFLFLLSSAFGLSAANPSFTDMFKALKWTNDQGTIRLSTNTFRIGFFDTNTFIHQDLSANLSVGYAAGGKGPMIHSVESTLIGVEAGGLLDGTLGSGGLEDSVGIGYRSLRKVNGAANCVSIGTFAMENLINGNQNTGVGESALQSNVSSDDNTGVGYQILDSLISGQGNSGLGRDVFGFMTFGDYNTGAGYRAGFFSQTNYGTFLGAFADQVDFPGIKTNVTAIGWNTKVGQDNTVQLGNELTEKVITPGYYIGTNGLASYSILATNAVTPTGVTNTASINRQVRVTATAVSYTINDRSGAVLDTTPVLTATLIWTLQPGWSIRAASGLVGTMLPF